MKVKLTIIRGKQTREQKRQEILNKALQQREDFKTCTELINRILANTSRLEADLCM